MKRCRLAGRQSMLQKYFANNRLEIGKISSCRNKEFTTINFYFTTPHFAYIRRKIV
jgi:hypothetical protein